MLTTNLLSPDDKTIIGLAKAAKLIRIIAIFSCGLLITNAVFILPTLLPLAFERKELVRELATGKETQQKFQVSEHAKELKAVSMAAREIRTYISKPRYSSKIIDAFGNTGIPGISLETITVTETGELILNGRAATRNALLDLEAALKRSPYIDSISSPLSNIIRESNISFSIKGTLKPNILDGA